MSVEARSYVEGHLIPPAAQVEWEALEAVLGSVRWVPCRLSPVPDAWWSGSPRLQAQAVEGCQGCAAVQECAAYAVAAGERYGVWGGRTPADRGFRCGRRDGTA